MRKLADSLGHFGKDFMLGETRAVQKMYGHTFWGDIKTFIEKVKPLLAKVATKTKMMLEMHAKSFAEDY